MTLSMLALAAIVVVAVLAWAISLAIKDVSFVDSLWSLFFLLAGFIYAIGTDELGVRGQLVLILLGLWSIRLCLHITVRNWGAGEDYRYQTIRRNNEPNFEIKALYIVFGLQGLLAWIISAPLLPAIGSASSLTWLDGAALALWLVGFVFEALGDHQLRRFKADPENSGKVMDRGLWRFTRHPNYFGDFCVWWAFWLFAVASGAWWTVFAPLLMTLLLLKISGVAMLERTIAERRPAYARYVASTNAFFPGPGRRKAAKAISG